MDVHQFLAILMGQNDVLLRCFGCPPLLAANWHLVRDLGLLAKPTSTILKPINCKVYLPSAGPCRGRSTICSWLEICRTCSSRRCNWPAGRSYTASETDQLMFLVVFHGWLVVSTPMKNISNSQLGLLFPILKYTKIIDI